MTPNSQPFTNQTMINAFFAAADELGKAGWDLVVKAEQQSLASARQERYTGPPVDEFPSLTKEERAAIKRQLSEFVSELRPRRGTTTANLNLRAGPGTEHEVLEVLKRGTEVEVLEEQGEWMRATSDHKEGWVHGGFVLVGDEAASSGFLRLRPGLANVRLAPPQSETISLDSIVGDATARVLAETWNRYGGLLAVLANELKIDPAAAVAVFTVEAPGGRGFAPDGRMIIRFENHIFYNRWGKRQPQRFFQHFTFDDDKRWQGHHWRAAPNQAWNTFHGDQSREWQVLEFARSLDENAALSSISMGAPQIMGFNHAAVGYESTRQMFDSFSESVRNQIIGFFDFVKGTSPESRRVRALQAGDFNAFAELYNGSGQAAFYGGLIDDRFETFHKVKARERMATREARVPVAFARPDVRELEEPRGTPLVSPRQVTCGLSEQDPELYRHWRENVRQGFERNDEMFHRVLDGLSAAHTATIWMYRSLLGISVAAFAVAVGLSIWNRNAAFGLVFGGLSAIALLTYLVGRRWQRQGENLEFITWLGVVYNTYLARLAYMLDADTVQTDLSQAHADATAEIEHIIDKHAEMS